MHCFCGSLGKVNDRSDVNLLTVLKRHEGSLPRKAWGCVILCDLLCYHIVYWKCNPTKNDNAGTYAHMRYSPPQDGGQFKMPKIYLSAFPVLGEFARDLLYVISVSDSSLEVTRLK